MSVNRGDVVLAWYPFASGHGAKRRPCVVVQNDIDNAKLSNTVVVQITSNLGRVADKSHLLIQAASRMSAGSAGSLPASACRWGATTRCVS
jgi:mRNA-degrading endonuclease toxin of MazEF toxin-antitoxin module